MGTVSCDSDLTHKYSDEEKSFITSTQAGKNFFSLALTEANDIRMIRFLVIHSDESNIVSSTLFGGALYGRVGSWAFFETLDDAGKPY